MICHVNGWIIGLNSPTFIYIPHCLLKLIIAFLNLNIVTCSNCFMINQIQEGVLSFHVFINLGRTLQNTKDVSLIYCVKLSSRKKEASSPIGQYRFICSLGFNFRVCSERLSYPIIFQQRSKYSHPFFSAVPSYYRMKSYNS